MERIIPYPAMAVPAAAAAARMAWS
jgi:hypothetical protein